MRNQFISGSTSMKLESVKKHEQSMFHKDTAGAHRAHVSPGSALMELAAQSMEWEEMKKLLKSAFYFMNHALQT